ncbi:uncharacterized protein LOC113376328 [Ctenocephalides felis]|uniref:uncharacterized protein LOC113376328 n=1 Tax=Ctenocephalides felis TaxID=7515 RepID=UPI000E6E13B0|nr:uncharacterized protein LOC113376328 [Ctenocephalides felis]
MRGRADNETKTEITALYIALQPPPIYNWDGPGRTGTNGTSSRFIFRDDQERSPLQNSLPTYKNFIRRDTAVNPYKCNENANVKLKTTTLINGPTQENRRPPSLACSPDPNTCRLPTNFNLQHGKSTPRSSPARRMLGSIERSMHRVRRALMPRRSHLGGTPKTARTNPWTPNSAEAVKIMPQVLNAKNLSNVSTTTAVDPALVLLKLRTALYEKGIFCKQKGYTLRGRMELCKEPKPSLSNLVKTPITTANDEQKPFIHNSNSNSSNEVPNSKDSNCYCSFELEVCLLDTAALGGGDSRVLVRRKRLKGDAWCYKKVCEEVLRITSTEFLDDESFLGVTRFDGNDSY